MKIWKLVLLDVALLVAAAGLCSVSLSWANFTVESGLFTGIGNPRILDLPLTGGLGIAVTNLLTLLGSALIINSIIYAATAIRWENVDEVSNET